MTAPEDYPPGNGRRAKDLTATLAWEVDPERQKLRPGAHLVSAFTETDAAADDPPGRARTPCDHDPADWFCAGYGPFRRLTGGSAEGQWLVTTPGPTARMASLFYEGVALTEAVRWLTGMQLRALEGREAARDLEAAALQVLADGLLPNGCQVVDVNSDGLWVASHGHRLPLREMGHGSSSVVALVADLIKQIYDCYGDLYFEVHDGVPMITAPGVVLIDEAEARLDASWQQRIGTWLKTHFPNVQFIVSTGSPYICQAADPGGLIHLPGPRRTRLAHKVFRSSYHSSFLCFSREPLGNEWQARRGSDPTRHRIRDRRPRCPR